MNARSYSEVATAKEFIAKGHQARRGGTSPKWVRYDVAIEAVTLALKSTIPDDFLSGEDGPCQNHVWVDQPDIGGGPLERLYCDRCGEIKLEIVGDAGPSYDISG